MVAQIDSLYIRTSLRQTIVRLLSYIFFEGRPLTTKGQWINPLVLSLFAVQQQMPQMKSVRQPIFIIGTGRSGTTILGTLLSMHRQVGFLNEPKALWHAIYPQEDLVGSYSRGHAHYRLSKAHASEQVKSTAHKLFGSYLKLTSTSRVVDKYPELIFRVPFVKALFPDAKFIFLVRNGWDTCQSIEGWSERLGVQVDSELHDWWGVNNRKWNLLWNQIVSRDPELRDALPAQEELESPVDMAVLEWVVSMREGLQLMQEYSNDILLLHYEELVSEPQEQLNALLEFCDLDPDPRFLEYAVHRLEPSTPRPAFAMHPTLKPFFAKTMTSLGYSIER